MTTQNESLVSEVPDEYRKHLVRKGTEFEGLVGIETGEGFVELKKEAFFASNERNKRPRKGKIDLTPLNALPRLECINLEFLTINYSLGGGPGLRELREIKFFSCYQVTEFLRTQAFPKLETAWLHDCDVHSLDGLMSCERLEHVELRGTPIDQARFSSSPSALERLHNFLFSWPTANASEVEQQIAKLQQRGVKVTFSAT